MLYCQGNAIEQHELGNITRNHGSSGYIYINTVPGIKSRISNPNSGAIAVLLIDNANVTPGINAYTYISADVQGNNIQTFSSPPNNNPNCCVNPIVNSLVVYEGGDASSNRVQWTTMSSFINEHMIGQNVPNPDASGAHGYTDNGYALIRLNANQQRTN